MYLLLMAVLNVILCSLVLAYIGFYETSAQIKHDDRKRTMILVLGYIHIGLYVPLLVLYLYQWYTKEEYTPTPLSLILAGVQLLVLVVFYGWVVRLMHVQDLSDPTLKGQLKTVRRLTFLALIVPTVLSVQALSASSSSNWNAMYVGSESDYCTFLLTPGGILYLMKTWFIENFDSYWNVFEMYHPLCTKRVYFSV